MPPVILLHSGGYFNLARPSADDVHIVDIAHALSNLCRFTGHCNDFYSVAQHSVLASRIVPPELALETLLHDATEAYVGDMSSPLKHMLPEYKRIEARVWAAICERFDLPVMQEIAVKDADLSMLVTEKRDIMPATDMPWPVDATHQAMPFRITAWAPAMAKREFLARFYELANRRP